MDSFINRFFKGDAIIWSVIVLLAIVSAIEVYSSTGTLAFKYQDGNTSYYILKHASFLLMGFGVIWAVHNVHYKIFSYFATIALGISIVLLIITLFKGENINGASRWLKIPFIGISFQPSEVAKLALIIYSAKILSKEQGEDSNPKKAFKHIMIATGTVCGLIAFQDLSTTVLIGGIIMTLMFIGRIPLKYLLGTVGSGLALIIVIMLIAPHFEDVKTFNRVNTWKQRLETYFNAEEVSSDSSYQSDQAKIAVSTGGLLGKFFGNSRQSHYLPHPYSDYIYAIIVEEGGFFIGIFIIFLYLTLLYRAIYTARRCKATFPVFLICGLSIALVLQAFSHIFVCIGIFPVTGQTLPFVSMGGTSILLTSLSLGMILSVTQYGIPPKDIQPAKEYEPNEEINEYAIQNSYSEQ